MTIDWEAKVRFVSSYKQFLKYENEEVIIKVYEYRYEFEQEEILKDLKDCEYFDIQIK